MISRVWHSPYELHPRTPRPIRQGTLLRVELEALGPGYADCHPWPELGDAPLATQLQSIARGRPETLARNSLAIARTDAEARARGQSLFAGLSIPESHYQLAGPDAGELEGALARGFDRIKLKCGSDWTAHLPWLRSALHFMDGRARLRLDFNGALTPAGFAELVAALPPDQLEQIDFVEDPVPFDPRSGFGAAPVPLALDREAGMPFSEPACPEVLIAKPALHDAPAILVRAARWKRRAIVTSYLDHPLGQLSAAWVAAKAGVTERCGLLSHTVYEATEMSEVLCARGPRLTAPEGPGLGLGEQLARRRWVRLC